MAKEAASTEGAEAEASAEKVSRVKGLTTPDFEGVGIRTLETWLKYWQTPEKYEKDNRTADEASAEVTKLTAEIEARAAAKEQRAADKKAADEAKAAKKAEKEAEAAAAGETA